MGGEEEEEEEEGRRGEEGSLSLSFPLEGRRNFSFLFASKAGAFLL